MKLSDAEWAVMNAVWGHAPANARDVLDRVYAETGWAYTTAKTVLDRLVEKGALRVEKRGNTSYYDPRVTRREARHAAIRALLDRAFDGTVGSLLHHLVSEERLSRRDRAQLAAMLEQLERPKEGKP
jgi:predicted transcriptional regulator